MEWSSDYPLGPFLVKGAGKLNYAVAGCCFKDRSEVKTLIIVLVDSKEV